MINVLIPEEIPSENKGEAALFFGIAKSLALIGPHRIILFSMHPEKDRHAYGQLAHPIDVRGLVPDHMLDGHGALWRKAANYIRFVAKCAAFGLLHFLIGSFSLGCMRHAAWRCCVEADIVLMCHDSFYAPLYHGPLILLFKLLGKPVLLYGSTIIPPGSYRTMLEARLRNAFNRFVLNQADWISLREHYSFRYLQELGIRSAAVHPDLAFIVDSSPDEEVKSILKAEGIPMEVQLCGFAFSQKEIDYACPELPPLKRKERALDALAGLLDHITGVLGLHAVFIPHAIGPSARLDDRIAADWVWQRCTNQDMIHIIRNNYNQPQLKGMARCLDLTVGTRLHFTIDAVCHQVPSLLITHRGEFRCYGIIGDMLGQSEYICNIETTSAADLTRMVSDLWHNRQQVRAHLAQRVPLIAADVLSHALRAKALLESGSGTEPLTAEPDQEAVV